MLFPLTLIVALATGATCATIQLGQTTLTGRDIPFLRLPRDRARDPRLPANKNTLAARELRPSRLLPGFTYAETRPRARVQSLPQKTRDDEPNSSPSSQPFDSPITPLRRNSLSLSPVTHSVLPSTLSFPTIRKRSIMSNIPKFSGDTTTDSTSAEDWMRSCRVHYRERGGMSSADKLEDIADRFVYGSTADNWFKNMPAADKATWDLFTAAFQGRFEGVKSIEKQRPQLIDELFRMTIGMDEIAQPPLVIQGRSVVRLHAFAHRVKEAANAARVGNEEVGVWGFFEALPAPIRVVIGTQPANWSAMAAVEMHTSAKGLQDQVSTLTAQFHAMQLATAKRTTNPTPAANPPAPAPGRAPPAPAPPAPPAAPPPNAPPAGRQQRQPPTQADKDGLERILAQTIASMVPDTVDGHARYAGQIARWTELHGHIRRDDLKLELIGYPLSPGSVVPCSGECYRCGLITRPLHRNGPCPAPEIPSLERAFRAVCGTWLGRRNAPGVNAVGVENAEANWFDAEQGF
ncbi:hypothetical protein C8F01DRAFT_1266323 [Mycena amicta]|nr:hypothetical protein C8F01DRAFT_1266323 [Mycena amicta]